MHNINDESTCGMNPHQMQCMCVLYVVPVCEKEP